MPLPQTQAELTARLRALADGSPEATVIIGIAGPPGAGKTTLAEALLAELNRDADGPEAARVAHVPMDGFHLSDRELARLGLLERKGAPETFDAYGYAALLDRLRPSVRGTTVYAPGFERTLEQPVAGDIPVFPAARLILTEGNYLLLDRPEWRRVRSLCTEVWYCEQDEDVRIRQLVQRHIRFGKPPGEAAAWVRDVDGANAALVRQSRTRADLLVRST